MMRYLVFFLASFLAFGNGAVANDIQATKYLESIVLGAGCFWGAEKRYAAIPGVIDAISGYADGTVAPNYREITQSRNKLNPFNHAEVVKVLFNSSVVSAEEILRQYFEGHDPTQVNRQGNDIGTQYRSIVLTTNEKQASTAEKVLTKYQDLLNKAGYGKVSTKIKPLEKFYLAEDYHQDYLIRNPNGYCPDHSTGVKFVAAGNSADIDNSSLFEGKQVVIIESETCPYCREFRNNVLANYQGTIPVTSRLASQLKDLQIKTPTWATPTILFLENGVEVFGRQGYLDPDSFYHLLGRFKLGQVEAFDVAFNQGTDARYCRQYEIFKNTPDGVFIDKLSGAALFDTRDRFNSGSGWLSFTKAIDDSVTEHQDNSFGMSRVEIRAKVSGIHLGHVFADGPEGKQRYCINATVLEFKPRESG